jgi:hypothetical protein
MGQIASLPNGIEIIAESTLDNFQPNFQPQADNWVQLRNLPSTYSYDRAILICPIEQDAWIAWVPDYGEILLQRSQFHRSGD